jgi:tetratricopeptide (TPR) repeat protein
MAPDSEVVVARTITRHLGGLPLALDQAGAYIAENRCSLSHYLDLLTREQQRLLQRRGTVSSDHPQSVTATFSLAFEQIRQKNTAASDLLNVCAFLAPDAIPLDMITEGAAHLGPILATVAVDALQFDQSLERLQTYSLVRRDGENRTISIHRLVQAVLKDKLEEAEKPLWTERAMLAVNTAFPRVEHGTWSQCERLLPHALLIAQHIETYRIVGEEAGCLLHETATYLRDRARYPEAEPLFQRALRIREQHLGPEHPDVATTLTGLANLYRMQGKYVEAEPLFQQAIGINEQQPWPKHSEVAYPLNSLAILYQEQGKYAEAEPLYLRALAIWEQQLGLDHPLVAHPLNGLAELYFEQEKYAEAEPLYLRALRIREQSLGFQHPDTAETMHDLARLQDTQGNSEEARDWYVRALAVREQALGGHHPKTTETRMHLTALRHAMVQNEEATQLEAPHSEQRKRTSEEDHPEE